MQTTGFGLSALMIAGGAILAWAVTYDAEGVDLNQVGIIIFVVGLALAAFSLLASLSGRRTTVSSESHRLVDGRPVVEEHRDVVAER